MVAEKGEPRDKERERWRALACFAKTTTSTDVVDRCRRSHSCTSLLLHDAVLSSFFFPPLNNSEKTNGAPWTIVRERTASPVVLSVSPRVDLDLDSAPESRSRAWLCISEERDFPSGGDTVSARFSTSFPPAVLDASDDAVRLLPDLITADRARTGINEFGDLLSLINRAYN